MLILRHFAIKSRITTTMATAWRRLVMKPSIATVTAVDCTETVPNSIPARCLAHSLRERGYATFETPLDEFVKAGGSAKCLTLRLDGEEAADWKCAAAQKHDAVGR